MPCELQILRRVPLFALLDDDEATLLASRVATAKFDPRQRVYKIGEPGKFAYVMLSGRVRVATHDEDGQEVIVDEPSEGEFFGFASMLDMTPHQTEAMALEETLCLEVSRDNIEDLLKQKPHAGMDMLTVLGPPVSQLPATRPRAHRPKSQRSHRRQRDNRREDRR